MWYLSPIFMASSHSFVDKSTQSLVLDIVDFTSIYSSITEVIEKNPDCIIDGKYKDGVLVINVDARKQDYHQHTSPCPLARGLGVLELVLFNDH
jgi:hypothetical protein